MESLEAPLAIRESFLYNNMMYAVAGEIIASRSQQKSWEQHLQRTIFVPLGMRRSAIPFADFERVRDRAEPYTVGFDEGGQRVAMFNDGADFLAQSDVTGVDAPGIMFITDMNCF